MRYSKVERELCFNPQREGYKQVGINSYVDIGYAFQSPKGRLQTLHRIMFDFPIITFQSPKGRLQTSFTLVFLLALKNCFNPQREGYKHVRKLSFIISTLYTHVNVFILKHLWKTQKSPEKSKD